MSVDPVAPVIVLKFIPSEDDCHCKVPTEPLTVKTVLFVPAHTVVCPLITPPLAAGVTEAVTGVRIELVQLPNVAST